MNTNMHANPVGMIKKDIYIIKNDVNHKVYIGQAIDADDRFKGHCKPSQNKCLIDKAINKYGKKHFWFEILEKQILNYNERESYWIAYYNSKMPNGYNMTDGGEEPPIMKGNNHPNVKISDEDVIKLKNDLKNTDIPLSKLAKKYKISKRQVLRINQGISRSNLNEKYPIREKPNLNGKLTEEDVDEIIDLLKYTYFFNGEIARRFNVDVHTINNINQGIRHKRDNIEYPIRKWKSCGVTLFTYEQVTDIINLLQNSKESINSIAKRYKVSPNSIKQINNGSSKKYKRDNLQYPIRKY